MESIILEVLKSCAYFSEYNFQDYLHNLKHAMEKNPSLNEEAVKAALLAGIKDQDLNWVDLAIRSKFVYTSFDMHPTYLTVDGLIGYTESSYWGLNSPDGRLSLEDKNRLKEQVKKLDFNGIENIHDLMNLPEFSWLPFEVKHAFKINFGELEYNREDIIYYLKRIVWLDFFPELLIKERLIEIRETGFEVLRANNLNQGWMEMEELLIQMSESFPEIDLFELSQVRWPSNVNDKIHYRNPFTLGFKRLQR